MTRDLFPHPNTVLVLAILFALLFVCSGCGTRTDNDDQRRSSTASKQQTVTKEVIRETPLANGGKVIERTLTTSVVSDERTDERTTGTMSTGLDADTSAMASTMGRIAGAVVGPAVSQATGGILSGGEIAAALSAITGAGIAAWGAKRAGEARQLREERDFHKDDAEKGWKAALEPKAQA